MGGWRVSFWTDDRIELLKRMWAEGHSSGVIADRLGGGTTRNAVIGKVHRLGLRKADSAQRISVKRIRAQKQIRQQIHKLFNPFGEKRPRLAPTPIDPGPEPYVPPGERKGIDGLQDQDCRWPIGDPQSADFHFCGHERLPGLAYCPHHARRAYRPVVLTRGMPQRTHVFVPEHEKEDIE